MPDAMLHASLLPTVKCSTCGVEIQISLMGDHVCPVNKLENEAVASQWSFGSEVDACFESLSTMTPLEPARLQSAPVRISSMNRLSSSEPSSRTSNHAAGTRSISSAYSPDDAHSPRRRLARSATAPSPRSPSPPTRGTMLSQDGAFPPFPLPPSRSRSAGKLKPAMRLNTSGGVVRQDQSVAPPSPVTASGARVLRRMNTIVRGPFGLKNRRKDSKSPSLGSISASGNAKVVNRDAQGDESIHPTSHLPAEDSEEIDSPNSQKLLESLAEKGGTTSGPHFSAIDIFRESKSRSAQSRTSVPDIPVKSSLREAVLSTALQDDATNTSQTMQTQETNSSESGRRAARRRVASPGNSSQIAISDGGPLTPYPSVCFAYSGTSRAHTSSESASSNGSRSGSYRRTESSVSSAPTSATSLPSPTSQLFEELFDNKGLNIESWQQQPARQSQSPGYEDPQQDVPSTPALVERPARKTRAVNFSRPRLPESVCMQPPVMLAGDSTLLGSPTETFSQDGHQPQMDIPNVSPAEFTNALEQTPFPSFEVEDLPQPQQRRPRRPELSTRTTTTPSKGNCRGCRQVIIGKSVKAADGRLTGRYHRDCFVCRTCNEPFETADFYVIDNEPYCAQHYHFLNRSICHSCDTGIEGKYVEADAARKYHTDCFVCHDCSQPLTGGYFEIDEAVYCEADALRCHRELDLLGPGRRFPERRTTRLMMM